MKILFALMLAILASIPAAEAAQGGQVPMSMQPDEPIVGSGTIGFQQPTGGTTGCTPPVDQVARDKAARVHQRVKAVGETVAETTRRMGELEERLKAVRGRLAKARSRAARGEKSARGDIVRHEQAISTLEKRLEHVREVARIHRRALNAIKARVDDHEVSIKNLKAGQRGLEGRVSRLEGTVFSSTSPPSPPVTVTPAPPAPVLPPPPPVPTTPAIPLVPPGGAPTFSLTDVDTPSVGVEGNRMNLSIPSWLGYILFGVVIAWAIFRPRCNPRMLREYLNALRSSPLRPEADFTGSPQEGVSFTVRVR